ncbi:MAG: ATP-dependent DNA helicase Rep [Gammaproteobacteria bacterium]|nr:MAG: ATP-dependent DNA helicase Rep [Gammaproteobacteria bacterium]
MSVLNPQQNAAVRQYDRPLLVLAGAGSGKTRVITQKIAWLIDHKQVPAHQIVAVTFTNKAAREMKQRVDSMLKDRSEGLIVSTFHSLGLRILRRNLQAAGLKRGFSIFDSDDSLKVIKELMKGGSKEEDIQHRRWQISSWKNDDLSPEKAIQNAETGLEASTAELYMAYQRQLKAYNAVDFDDLINQPLRLLRDNADILQRWRSSIAYLLVDEYQDTNTTQYELLKLLLGDRTGLTAVGDDDQSIYAWRGARPENLERLKSDYPSLEVIKLEQNYRSTGRILTCANQLIKNNPHTFEKRLWSELAPGDPIRVMQSLEPEHEAEAVVSAIIAQRFRKRTPLGDFAILYRGNHQSRPLEKVLRTNKLPYTISGGMSFFDRSEVKDVLAYLRLITNTDDDAAFLRIINTPRRQIGAATLEKLGHYASDRGVSLLNACHELGLQTILDARARQRLASFIDLIDELTLQSRDEPPARIVRRLLKQIHYADWLRDISKDDKTADQRNENIEDLVSWIERMGEKDDMDLTEAVAQITLLDMLDKNSGETESDTIHLMTLHAAKGLEFPHVYLIGFEEELLPHKSSIEEDNIEEERRLAYVGITRAQRSLTLSYTSKRRRYGDDLTCEPSRFLDELPRDHLHFDGDEKSGEDKKETGQAHLAHLKALLG